MAACPLRPPPPGPGQNAHACTDTHTHANTHAHMCTNTPPPMKESYASRMWSYKLVPLQTQKPDRAQVGLPSPARAGLTPARSSIALCRLCSAQPPSTARPPPLPTTIHPDQTKPEKERQASCSEVLPYQRPALPRGSQLLQLAGGGKPSLQEARLAESRSARLSAQRPLLPARCSLPAAELASPAPGRHHQGRGEERGGGGEGGPWAGGDGESRQEGVGEQEGMGAGRGRQRLPGAMGEAEGGGDKRGQGWGEGRGNRQGLVGQMEASLPCLNCPVPPALLRMTDPST